jgi:purine-binding chemotaxis protein CheW
MADIGIIKFQLGGMNFCMYADQILEIVRYTSVCKIPKPLPYVVGLIELRKHIVVVVDLRKRLGLPSIALSKDMAIIVANLSVGMMGILVEAISDFRRVSDKMILPSISIAGLPEHLLSGVFAEEDDIMLIPDFDKIFSSYLNIQLMPISPSEKVAFQYRFTPGSLTRTLENNVHDQHYLDHEVVRKLSRSLCLPSVLVHKMTSYYPDFQPHEHSIRRKDQRWRQPQESRAGDKQYLSLSQQLPQQKLKTHRSKAKEERQDTSSNIMNSLIPDPHAPIPNLLEDILHTLKSSRNTTSKIQPDALTSQPAMGRSIAKTLRVSPTHITKYFTYYSQVSSTKYSDKKRDQSQLSMRPSQSLQYRSGRAIEKRLQKLLTRNQCPEGENVSCLLRTLQSLHNDGFVLTRQHIQKICAFYQLSPVKIAKLVSFFPEYSLVLKEEEGSSNNAKMNGSETRKQETVTKEEAVLEPLTSSLVPYLTSVSESISHLAEEDKLSQDHYVRYAASRLRVTTCRLSKLRSYYRWNNEQTD